jgi:hypothetical protein
MISGRVDEMRNGKVHGWAFNTDDRSERLQIQIMRDNEVVASGIADAFREDLPYAGVGDGKHAFGIPVPPTFASFVGLSIIARTASHGQIELAIANNDERKIDSLFADVTRRYDTLLLDLKRQVDGVREGVNIEWRDDVEDRLTRIEKRLEDFEVFIMRIDEMTRKLQERVGLLRPKGFFARFRRK